MRGLIYSSIAAAVLVTMSGSALAENSHSSYQFNKQKGGLTVVENVQNSDGNGVENSFYENNAGITDSFSNASGNVGANSAAGDNNAQNNSAALAAYDDNRASDERAIFGNSEPTVSIALVDSSQSTTGNGTLNYAHQNSASLGGSFDGASGNVVANVAAGNNNIQANTMSAVVTTGKQAIAIVNSNQSTSGNVTQNSSDVMLMPGDTVTVTTESYSSSRSSHENAAAGEFAAKSFTAGKAVVAAGYVAGSASEVHVDAPHHSVDFKASEVHGAAFAAGAAYAAVKVVGANFKTKYSEMSSSEMKNIASTTSPVMTYQIINQGSNNASIDSGSFNNASGNIGVNLAAGSNNLQANHLSLAAANSD